MLKDAHEKHDEELVTQFVQCIGIFPAGSLVNLNNKKIAMVLKQNPVHATKPMWNILFNTRIRGNHYLVPKELDSAAAGNGVKIVDALIASDYKLDSNKYFNKSIVI